MLVRFWGTRGSFAKPGRTTLRFGGNTSCVEVRASNGTVVVLDCGTGAFDLGRDLIARDDTLHGRLLIGHTHWDHIQGFPFFAPFLVPGHTWEIFAPGDRSAQLEACLAGQMSYEYFPITFDDMKAHVQLHELREGEFEIDGIRVITQFLNHPPLTLGYRLEADGAVLVYSTDHEPHSLYPLDSPPGAVPIHHEDRRHVRFLADADLVIHDAQYALQEFPAKSGWGHSPVERAVDYAMLARAKRLALFHHDPERTDKAVDRLGALAEARVAASDNPLQVFPAAEDLVCELASDDPRPKERSAPRPSALLPKSPRNGETVLVVDDDPTIVNLLESVLRADGLRVLKADKGNAGLELARQKLPSLVILDLQLPGMDGLEICRSLRADPNPLFQDVPIVILTGAKLQESDVVETFMAGATDYLTKPFLPSLVRSRVRAWLQRSSSRR